MTTPIRLVCAVVVALTICWPAAAAPIHTNHTPAQLHKSQSVVRFWNNHRWALHSRYARCADIPGRARQRVCAHARRSLEHHTRVQRTLRRQQWLTLPAVSDWRTAVRVTQRVYPGTERWLLSCSSSEGGHGEWVWNGGAPYSSPYHGSGAGGWMQFMSGTFWRMYAQARDHAQAQGFTVPRSTASFTSPLGQALAGAQGLVSDHAYEWTGTGC